MTAPVLAWADAPSRVVPRADLSVAMVSETVGACRHAFADALGAVILTGSVARSEETWARQDDGFTLLGDAEFLLLFRQGRRLPRPAGMDAVTITVRDRLRARRLRCAITLAPCDRAYLSGLQPSIFAYELRACGRVVWGDPAALRAVPSFSVQEIPREDAWRLLCNRLVEQLEPLAEIAWPPDGDLPPAVRYRTVKLYLDMATSLLVFQDRYAPSYRERARNLARLAGDARLPAGLPLSLPDFARKVAACTRFKLEGEAAVGLESWAAWREALRQARGLWRWEMEALAAAPAGASDDALRETWMRAQPRLSRARGWLYVARAEGWHRAWRLWPHWARLLRRGSPRHCVYAAATEVLFALAGAGGSASAPPDGTRPGRWLPVTGRGREGRDSFAALASDVVANYHRFLVDTRA